MTGVVGHLLRPCTTAFLGLNPNPSCRPNLQSHHELPTHHYTQTSPNRKDGHLLGILVPCPSKDLQPWRSYILAEDTVTSLGMRLAKQSSRLSGFFCKEIRGLWMARRVSLRQQMHQKNPAALCEHTIRSSQLVPSVS